MPPPPPEPPQQHVPAHVQAVNPPTPIIADKTPTKKPIKIGGIADMYNFERWNLSLKGRPCIQEC